MLLGISLSSFAQTKLKKTYETDPGVTVNIDAAHTNIIVENWDKDQVEITAYLESEGASEEQKEHLLSGWKLKTSGTEDKITIKSGGGLPIPPLMEHEGLQEPLALLPEMMEPMMEMIGPILENIAQNPLPPEMMSNLGNIEFDHEAYKEEGDAYLERWEKEIEKNFGEDFEKDMEEWAANFEKDTLWQKKLEADMEEWGEKFGASMEVWGEKFGKSMESWAKEFEKEMELRYGEDGPNTIIMNPAEAKKTIRIRMPEKGNLELNIRHGKVKLSGTSNNLKADLSHSQFSANTIAGKESRVKAFYTPVNIQNWNYGVLTTGYVKDAKIGNVKSLKLISNSSDMEIERVEETAIISGTFGELKIDELASDFDLLDISLQNTDLILDLPESALIFSYEGAQSEINYPESITGEPVERYGSKIINGFQGSRGASGTVSINAKFSNVDIK